MNLALCGYIYMMGDKIQESANDDKMQRMLNMIAYDKSLEIKFNGQSIDGEIGLETKDGEQMSLMEATRDDKMLVARYADINCNSCVDTLMTHLAKKYADIGEGRIVVLSNYGSRRDYINFIRINGLDFEIYNLSAPLCDADSLNVPYMFILEGNKKINDFFIPRKEYPRGIDEYLEFAKKILE